MSSLRCIKKNLLGLQAKNRNMQAWPGLLLKKIHITAGETGNVPSYFREYLAARARSRRTSKPFKFEDRFRDTWWFRVPLLKSVMLYWNYRRVSKWATRKHELLGNIEYTYE